MKRMNLTLDDVTYRNLKALAALKDSPVAKLIKFFVDREIKENPEECELCRKYGNIPNAETRKALEASAKGKGLSGPFKNTRELFDHLDKDE